MLFEANLVNKMQIGTVAVGSYFVFEAASYLDVSRIRITSCPFWSDKEAGLLKHNVRFIITDECFQYYQFQNQYEEEGLNLKINPNKHSNSYKLYNYR